MSARVIQRLCAVVALTLSCCSAKPLRVLAAGEPEVFVLGPMPGLTDGEEATSSAALLKGAGYSIRVITPDEFAGMRTSSVAACEVLVIPHADHFPAVAQPNLLHFLDQGGRVLCIDGPPFTSFAYRNGSRWSNLSDRLAALPDRPILDLRGADLRHWSRASNDPMSASAITHESSPVGGALHLRFSHYTGWDNFGPPPFEVSPFPSGASLTTFWARSDNKTSGFVMEWRERDGSRWMKAIKLTPKWQRFVLSPNDFLYWPDSTSRGRGAEGDHFQPANAVAWRIGLAESHIAQSFGAHDFWIAKLGAATLPPDIAVRSIPDLECLSPASKLFMASEGSHHFWTAVIRNRGIGMMGQRTGRLILTDPTARLDSYSSPSRAWVYVAFNGKYAGAAWGDISTEADLNRTLLPTMSKLLQRRLLAHGGVDKPYYHAGEAVTAGAGFFGSGSNQKVRIGVSLEAIKPVRKLDPSKSAAAIESVLGESHPTDVFSATFADLSPGEYRAHVTMSLVNAKGTTTLIDAIDEPFRVVSRGSDTGGAGIDLKLERFIGMSKGTGRVIVRGSEFVRNGRPWRPVGVNYWPLWIAGQDVEAYRLHWISPAQYDPDLVERDIALCQRLGVNVLSVQYSRPEEAPALNDLLARCRNHRLLANVFVAGADPLAFDPDELTKLVDSADLRNNPTVFAFDVAWEPHVGHYEQRQRLDIEWRSWVAGQYGSEVSAQLDWGVAAPRDAAGELTGPSDQMLSEDGPWRVLVAAYRRFLDDRISRGYRKTVEILRPYGALIGARSGYGGNGFAGVAAEAPYDLVSGAAHLDFISPEGYALSGSWDEMRAGGLTAAYARWAGAGKPVFWAEFGRSVYPDAEGNKTVAQADYYDKFYRMVVDSGSNGSSAWWFPGGLRVDENSDYGLVSPDGSPRAAALRLQRHAIMEMPNAQVAPEVDSWLTIDRDADARGYVGVFERLRASYVGLRSKGLVPGIQTVASGLTLESVPLTAVGNTEPVEPHGLYPLKYLNAEMEMSPDSKTLTITNTSDIDWTRSRGAAVGIQLTPNPRTLILDDRPNPKYRPDPDDRPNASDEPKSRWLAITANVPRYGSITVNVNRLLAIAPGQTFIAGSLRMALVRTEDGVSATYPFGESVNVFH